MNFMIYAGVLLLAFSLPASADKLACSVKAAKTTAASALPGMAKVSKAAAEKAALAKVTAASKQVSKSELEVEDGCLVYSFDIKVAGKSGVEEVMVDAGNGKVLSHKHESAMKEAAENAADKLKPKK